MNIEHKTKQPTQCRRYSASSSPSPPHIFTAHLFPNINVFLNISIPSQNSNVRLFETYSNKIHPFRYRLALLRWYRLNARKKPSKHEIWIKISDCARWGDVIWYFVKHIGTFVAQNRAWAQGVTEFSKFGYLDIFEFLELVPNLKIHLSLSFSFLKTWTPIFDSIRNPNFHYS